MKLRNIAEVEQLLAKYIPAASQQTGKDITLTRMWPLLEAVGNPQTKLKIIHVAGTSGKTSTSYYLSSILSQAGKKVGLTVSPHVDSVTERVQINLQPIAEQKFCESLSEFMDLVNNVDPEPTYFELMMAFEYWSFYQAGVDYAVIETGLGGLHDASNVAQREDKVCVITDIGFDHMHVLGNTIAEIAQQKAGIMHSGNQTFIFEQSSEVMKIMQATANKVGATLHITTEGAESIASHVKIDSLPLYQQRNWLLAYSAISYISVRDGWQMPDIQKLASSAKLQVPGRMEMINLDDKILIMDGAHNGQKIEAFARSFKQKFSGQKVAFLIAMKTGKDFHDVLPIIKPLADQVIFTNFSLRQELNFNSIDPNELAAYAKSIGIQAVTVEPDLQKAYGLLTAQSQKIMVVTGSIYLISQLRGQEQLAEHVR